MTGTKTACDGGECGACTILVDDRPRLSCLTLVGQVEGAQRRYRRGARRRRPPVAGAGRLPHEARRAVRCLHARLRHGDRRAFCGAIPSPSDDDIREALGSNICRCTGYVKIIEAVHYAAERMQEKAAGTSRSSRSARSAKHVPMVDGPRESLGPSRKYARPTSSSREALAGRIYRSPYSPMPRSFRDRRLRGGDAAGRQVAIVTGADCDVTFGVLPIAYSASTRWRVTRCATRANRLRPWPRSTMRPRKGGHPPHQGDGEGAAGLLTTPRTRLADDAVDLHEHRPGNVERDVFFELGDVDGVVQQSDDLVLERDFFCPEVCQAQMEMHAAVADYDPIPRPHDGATASTQVPFYVHHPARPHARHAEVEDPRDQAASSAAASAAGPRR